MPSAAGVEQSVVPQPKFVHITSGFRVRSGKLQLRVSWGARGCCHCPALCQGCRGMPAHAPFPGTSPQGCRDEDDASMLHQSWLLMEFPSPACGTGLGAVALGKLLPSAGHPGVLGAGVGRPHAAPELWGAPRGPSVPNPMQWEVASAQPRCWLRPGGTETPQQSSRAVMGSRCWGTPRAGAVPRDRRGVGERPRVQPWSGGCWSRNTTEQSRAFL